MRINSAFPSQYLKAEDLDGKAVRVTIKTVSVEKLGDEQKPVLHFVGKEKTLVLNKTNANRIVEAVGSDETDDWRGWSIVLYPCMVDYAGKRVPAIRVDDRPGATRKPTNGAPQQSRPAVREPEPEPEQIEDNRFVTHDIPEDDIPF